MVTLARCRRCLHRREGPSSVSQQRSNAATQQRSNAATQQRSNPAIAISTELACQLDHVGNQAFLVSAPLRRSSLGRPMPPRTATKPTFANLHLAAHVTDAGPTTGRAQKVPLAASDRINLSSVRSDTARRSRSFCFLEPLQFLELCRAHSAILLVPAIIGLFRDADLPDRVDAGNLCPISTSTCRT